MTDKKQNRESGRKWDGRSRPSNDLYKKNYDEIFKKKVLEGEDPFETNKRELKENYDEIFRKDKTKEKDKEANKQR